MILSVVFLFVMSYLLASRNLMLVLYAFTIAFAIYHIFKRKKFREGVIVILGLLLGIFLIFKFFPKTFNRYRELVYFHFDYQNLGKESHYNMAVTKDQWNGANFRVAAWRCGWELFLRSPIKGVDIGDKKDALMDKYREKKFQFGLQTQKNVHNNYLDILYSMGIIGLGLFLVGWLVLPLIFASNAMFPSKFMPDWLQPVVFWNPVSHATDISRQLLLGSSGMSSLGFDFLYLGAFASIMLVVGITVSWRYLSR